MPENEIITILIDPRARPAQLTLRLGPIAGIRAGRRRDFRVSDLVPYSDVLLKLADRGALRAFSQDLKPLDVDEFRARLGGSPAKASPEPPKVTDPEPTPEPSAASAEETPDEVTSDVPDVTDVTEVKDTSKQKRRTRKSRS